MKSLNQYIQEKLIINKDYRDNTIVVKSFKELRKIIEQRYEEKGPGTEQDPVDLNDIDVSGIKTLGFYTGPLDETGLFEKIEFEYIDISDWDVSNVTDISGLFYACYELKSIGDLSKWDVSKVESMIGMFAHYKTITSVGDLSNWDVSNVKYMSYMFHNSGIKNTPSWYKV